MNIIMFKFMFIIIVGVVVGGGVGVGVVTVVVVVVVDTAAITVPVLSINGSFEISRAVIAITALCMESWTVARRTFLSNMLHIIHMCAYISDTKY